jgi:hypothetical protein
MIPAQLGIAASAAPVPDDGPGPSGQSLPTLIAFPRPTGGYGGVVPSPRPARRGPGGASRLPFANHMELSDVR